MSQGTVTVRASRRGDDTFYKIFIRGIGTTGPGYPLDRVIEILQGLGVSSEDIEVVRVLPPDRDYDFLHDVPRDYRLPRE